MENGNGRPATEKQLDWLRSLADTRAMEDADRSFLLEHMKGFDTKLASKWIDALKVLPPKPKPKPTATARIPDEVPDGRYAVLRSDKTWVFYRVKTKEDNQGGVTYRILLKVLGAPGDFRYVRIRSNQEWKWALNEIIKDPGLHLTLFGLKVGACGICGSPLTDPVSIAMGIGPVCASKYGLDFGDEVSDDE